MTIRWIYLLVVTLSNVFLSAHAEFNECLGIEIEQLQKMEDCAILYDACQAGVEKLNEQLKRSETSSYHAVSLVSATTSKSGRLNSSSVALLVQLAPFSNCVTTPTNKSDVSRQMYVSYVHKPMVFTHCM